MNPYSPKKVVNGIVYNFNIKNLKNKIKSCYTTAKEAKLLWSTFAPLNPNPLSSLNSDLFLNLNKDFK